LSYQAELHTNGNHNQLMLSYLLSSKQQLVKNNNMMLTLLLSQFANCSAYSDMQQQLQFCHTLFLLCSTVIVHMPKQ